MQKRVKIIATAGPASQSFPVLKAMANAGANIIRINTKYCNLQEYTAVLENIKRIRNLEVMFDIKNLNLIPFLKKIDFQYLAVAFAEDAKKINRIRKLLLPKKIKIISKIETLKGIKNLDLLMHASEGIMIARGDLGKNIPLEQVPIAQKLIIKKCNIHKKMDITATEMLLSMTNSKIPERAEVSDVANAVLDGSDALMLSEETTIGKYPVLAVKIMKRIIDATQNKKVTLKIFNNKKL